MKVEFPDRVGGVGVCIFSMYRPRQPAFHILNIFCVSMIAMYGLLWFHVSSRSADLACLVGWVATRGLFFFRSLDHFVPAFFCRACCVIVVLFFWLADCFDAVSSTPLWDNGMSGGRYAVVVLSPIVPAGLLL